MTGARVTGGSARPSAANRSAIRAGRAQAPLADAPFERMSFAKRSADAPRVVLFDIDGVEYTVPAVVETGAALKLLTLLNIVDDDRRKGVVLLRELCGVEAVNALFDDASFTGKQWAQLVKVLWRHAFGPLERQEEDGQGN